MLDSIFSAIPPIHREGYRYIALFAAVTVVAFMIAQPLGWLMVVATVWCALFFRDPERVTIVEPNAVVSPADGVISFIGIAAPPPALNMGEGPFTRISVFMNVFDCHVNRAPVAGTVETVAYEPGLFLNAELDKASEDNERNGLVIRRDDGTRVGVVQIAGLVARRIVCFSKETETLAVGQRFGLIRFGSRVDVYMPAGATPLVALGTKTVAGETPIADFATVQATSFKAG